MNCVTEIPKKYIIKRWTKEVIESGNVDIASVSSRGEFGLASSLWRIQMVRNFHKLILASEDNINARQHCEEAFKSVKKRVIDEVGPVYFEEESDAISCSSEIIQNPPRSRAKGDHNKRIKSIIEKKCNQAKGYRKSLQMATLQMKIAVQASVQVRNDEPVYYLK